MDFTHGHGYSIIWGEDGSAARPVDVLQEVLARVQHLQTHLLPCEENAEVLYHLQQAVQWEEVRRQRRTAQGLLGTSMRHLSADAHTPEALPNAEPEPPALPEPEPPVHQPPNPELELDEHPNPLAIAMPIEEGRFLPQAVLASIEAQGIPYRLWVSTTFSNGETAAMRNNVKNFALRSDAPYILMTDNDLVFAEGDVEAMVDFLEEHHDFAAIAISKHGVPPTPNGETEATEPDHVDAGPVLFRRSVYEQVQYSNDNGKCECGAMCDTLRNMGQRIGFLTNRAVHHIATTKLPAK